MKSENKFEKLYDINICQKCQCKANRIGHLYKGTAEFDVIDTGLKSSHSFVGAISSTNFTAPEYKSNLKIHKDSIKTIPIGFCNTCILARKGYFILHMFLLLPLILLGFLPFVAIVLNDPGERPSFLIVLLGLVILGGIGYLINLDFAKLRNLPDNNMFSDEDLCKLKFNLDRIKHTPNSVLLSSLPKRLSKDGYYSWSISLSKHDLYEIGKNTNDGTLLTFSVERVISYLNDKTEKIISSKPLHL